MLRRCSSPSGDGSRLCWSWDSCYWKGLGKGRQENAAGRGQSDYSLHFLMPSEVGFHFYTSAQPGRGVSC